MALYTTKNGRVVFKKPEYMIAIPYVYDNTLKDYVLGSHMYDISAVIGDSIVIEQSDGETTSKYNELVASPLLESVSGSKYAFTAQCVDLQDTVLKSLFGALTVSGVEGAVAFHDDYIGCNVLIKIRFKGENVPDVILPMVKLNSKIFMQQLHSRVGQGNITGTAMSRKVAIKNLGNPHHLLQFSTPYNNETTYTPYAPVLFVPKNFLDPTGGMPIIHYSGNMYSQLDFSTGTITNNIYVNATSGTWQIGIN